MPRKKKTETEVTEVGTSKKRTTKKEKANLLKSEFTVADMTSWTDEECEAKEKEFQFKISDLRDILKSLLKVGADFNLLKNTLEKGLMTGYTIKCPHCNREYVVSSMELNRESNVTCKVCGTEYKEDENIKGIEMVTDKSVEDVVKDNETVTI